MQMKFFLAVGYGILVVDAYLVLASVASKMMKSQYLGYLPPFGSMGGAQPSNVMVLLIATWTATLAIGCLRTSRSQSNQAPASGSLWFGLVLVIVWLVYLVPMLIDLSRHLFVHGF